MFEKGEWMFSFDLKSGYHHVDVAQHHRKYLGFEWGGVTYTFVVLPFGLSSAPYVFTKMMRPLVRLWRSKGIKAIVYLDYSIFSSRNESSAKASSEWVSFHQSLSAGYKSCTYRTLLSYNCTEIPCYGEMLLEKRPRML